MSRPFPLTPVERPAQLAWSKRAMSDDLWRGPFVRVPWAILDEEWADDPKQLARYLRNLLELDRARRKRRRAYIPADVWAAILDSFGHRCAYCGRGGIALQREHRMPLALGGHDHPANLVPACGACNRRKFTSHPDHWPLVIEPDGL